MASERTVAIPQGTMALEGAVGMERRDQPEGHLGGIIDCKSQCSVCWSEGQVVVACRWPSKHATSLERRTGRERSWALACSRWWPEGWPEALGGGGRRGDGGLPLR